jgi:hypothetical protein
MVLANPTNYGVIYGVRESGHNSGYQAEKWEETERLILQMFLLFSVREPQSDILPYARHACIPPSFPSQKQTRHANIKQC